MWVYNSVKKRGMGGLSEEKGAELNSDQQNIYH